MRWAAPPAVLLLVVLHQLLLQALLKRAALGWHSLLELGVYGLTGGIAAWLGLTWMAGVVARREEAEARLRQAYTDLERAQQQLRLIQEVGRRVTSAADVQELLEIAAQVPTELLGARGAGVVTFDREKARAHLETTRGLDDRAVSALRRHVEADFPIERCITCRPLTARRDEDCPLLTPLQAEGCADDVNRIICLPLERGEERVGVIAAYVDAQTSPSPRQLNLVRTLTTEITTALEGFQRRASQMATFYAVDRITQEQRNLDSLLERVLDTILAGWSAEAGAILLFTEGEDGAWVIRAHKGLGDDLQAPGFQLALRMADRVRATPQPLIVEEQAGDDFPASMAVVPLQASGETLGALFLGSARSGTFVTAQQDLLKAIAHQIALAVRHVQLYSRLREMAMLEERYRLSREMHDGVAQTLGYLGLQAERLERLLTEGRTESLRAELTELRQAIAEAYQEVREAIDGLRLSVDEPGGLIKALCAHLEDFERRTGLEIKYTGPEDVGALAPEVTLQLLRIAQEALANVRRHAQARHVQVQLIRVDDHLELTVADDGHGFDPRLPQGRRGIGLSSMRERARSIGGKLTVASNPGAGTRVTVRVPLPG